MNTKETWGVNFRALCDLFEISKARQDVIEYKVGVQMIEIYNEQVRDLLVIDGSTKRYPFAFHLQLSLLKIWIFIFFKHEVPLTTCHIRYI